MTSAAQTGAAGPTSSRGLGSESSYGKLYTANDNTTTSQFNASHVGATVYKLDSYNKVVGTGTVVATSNPTTPTSTYLYTTGNATDTNPTDVWRPNEKYVVNARISKIYVQVYIPQLSLPLATGDAKHSLLLGYDGTIYTSEKAVQPVSFARVVDAAIGVAYQIVPKPSTLNNIPFSGTDGNDV